MDSAKRWVKHSKQWHSLHRWLKLLTKSHRYINAKHPHGSFDPPADYFYFRASWLCYLHLNNQATTEG